MVTPGSGGGEGSDDIEEQSEPGATPPPNAPPPFAPTAPAPGPPPSGPQKRSVSPTALGIGAIAVVIIVVLVIVLAGTGKSNTSSTTTISPSKGGGSGTSTSSVLGPDPAPSSLVESVTNVPESVFEQVGLPSEIANFPTKVTKDLSPLTSSGLPVMLYVGAEYCPFCAAERWAMIMALSKFGSFSGLSTIASSPSDFAPLTQTFTFKGSTYKSRYLVFEPYELSTNTPAASGSKCNIDGYACLETPSKAILAVFENVGGGSFPFMDFANKVAQLGAGFEDQPLVLAGLTHQQIAHDLYEPTSPVAQAEDGSANYITAAICTMTGDQPADVCSASYIKTAQQR